MEVGLKWKLLWLKHCRKRFSLHARRFDESEGLQIEYYYSEWSKDRGIKDSVERG